MTILLLAALAFASLTVWLRDPVWFRDMIWPRSIFQIVVVTAAGATFARRPQKAPWPVVLSLALPLTGLIQLAAGATVYAHATLEQTLHWMSLSAVLWLAYARADDARFRPLMLAFGVLEAGLCLTQLPGARNMVFWVFDSGFEEVAATFQSRNNFAQFIELVLPVALYMAWKDRKNTIWYAVGAGFLFSSVVASASRAGTVLCAAEILVFAIFGGRRFLLFSGAVLAAATGFAAAAGYESVLNRFLLKQPYEGRYEAAVASWKMIQERPLGFGLGAFPHVYPSHSIFDWGDLMMNHAHNDWAEFAVDGGVPFALLIAALFVPALPRLVRHPWALGVLAVLIHAFGDYPFPRAAVAGWLFAMLGLVYARASGSGAAWTAGLSRVFIPAALATIWFAGRHALAERAAQTPELESYRAAVRLAPGNANYLRMLAEAEPDRAAAGRMLDEAIRLNPFDSLVLIGAGTAAELSGDLPRAEKLLLEAARVDTMYLPRWNLANYYLRRGDDEKFWHWARKAAEIGSGELGPLFQLARRVAEAGEVARRIVPGRPHATREFVSFLLRSRETGALPEAVSRLVAAGSPEADTELALTAVDALLAAGDGAGAQSTWEVLRAKGWLPANATESFTAGVGRAFDWRFFKDDHLLTEQGAGYAAVSLDGRQIEGIRLAETWVNVPEAGAVLEVTYRTAGIPPGSGVRLRLMDRFERTALGDSPHMSSEGHSAISSIKAPAPGLARLWVIYERPSGFTRVKGSVFLEKFRMIR